MHDKCHKVWYQLTIKLLKKNFIHDHVVLLMCCRILITNNLISTGKIPVFSSINKKLENVVLTERKSSWMEKKRINMFIHEHLLQTKRIKRTRKDHCPTALNNFIKKQNRKQGVLGRKEVNCDVSPNSWNRGLC